VFAVNIMDIEITVLGEGDGPDKARKIFNETGEEALPVAGADGRLIGVLRKDVVSGANEGPRGFSSLLEKDFPCAGPEIGAGELEKMLDEAAAPFVLILDRQGRPLGRVRRGDLSRGRYELFRGSLEKKGKRPR